ncbi:unnamed protein product [Soboliphyme baturini]|uniref:Ephrin RBD domain-containing protein n=1 Tax=Soboliphyme baturini TaxID=241478 RepID=A0A183J336_9BILA|nr:unnamed protein product [Soboliphyme baturini]
MLIMWDRNDPFANNNDGIVIEAALMDFIEIHCPFHNHHHHHRDGQRPEYSVIYMVSRYGYENCILHEEQPVGQCTSPHIRTTIRLTLREFTPLPNGLEFKPGESFYFICTPSQATSDGTMSGLHQRSGGLCREENMRMVLHVLPDFDLANVVPHYMRHMSPKFHLPPLVKNGQDLQWKTADVKDDDNQLEKLEEPTADRHGDKFPTINTVRQRATVSNGVLSRSTYDVSPNLNDVQQAKLQISLIDDPHSKPLILYEIHEGNFI